jgi:hypothetical protein
MTLLRTGLDVTRALVQQNTFLGLTATVSCNSVLIASARDIDPAPSGMYDEQL